MIDIFNISIYKKNLNLNNKKLLRYILTLKKQSKGRNKSNPTGWQSFDLNLTQPIFSKLNKEITEYFLQYINQILLKNNFKISNMWANVNGYKDYNLMHYHPNAVVSGVYYLKVPKDSGQLRFHRTDATAFLNLYDFYKTTDTCTSFRIKPAPGMLVVFPASYTHSVEQSTSEEPRVSIAFNFNIIDPNK